MDPKTSKTSYTTQINSRSGKFSAPKTSKKLNLKTLFTILLLIILNSTLTLTCVANNTTNNPDNPELNINNNEIKTYNINYILHNDEDNAFDNPTTYTPDTLPIKIYPPSAKNYTFIGWTIICDNDTQIFLSTTIEPYELPIGLIGDITLIANWNYSYTITYDLYGGNYTDNPPFFYTMDMLPLEIDNPNRTGYTFTGWTIIYANNTIISRDIPISYEIPKNTQGNIILVAHWTPNDGNNNTNVKTSPNTTSVTQSKNPLTTNPNTPSDNNTEPTGNIPPTLSPSNGNEPQPPLNYEFLGWIIIFTSGLIVITITFRQKKPTTPYNYELTS